VRGVLESDIHDRGLEQGGSKRLIVLGEKAYNEEGGIEPFDSTLCSSTRNIAQTLASPVNTVLIMIPREGRAPQLVFSESSSFK
jgi:hypothetical protein